MMELKHLRIENPTEAWHKLWIDAQGRKLNVLFEELFDELRAVLEWLQTNDDRRPVVLCSAKEKGFVVGADLKRILSIQSDSQIQSFLKHGQDLLDDWEQLPNLTIAWIKGPCLGGGLELAMACRYRIVHSGPETQLGMPESKLGLTPGWGGTQRLTRLVGLEPAISMLLDGQPIDASRAVELGLAAGCWDSNQPIDAQMAAWISKLSESPMERTFADENLLNEFHSRSEWIQEQLDGGLGPQDGAVRRARLQILKCLALGLGEGISSGQLSERKGFYALLSSPECQAILSRFAEPKKP
jgi:3-hydroxyacyl-CoA dehydrogenase/enoyl-CoA hydratase/3-hydroxybutyryl-CoA epimerase